MQDKPLIDKIMKIKQENGYTLHDLSRITDFQVSTLGRWFKTGRINKIYAVILKKRMGIE